MVISRETETGSRLARHRIIVRDPVPPLPAKIERGQKECKTGLSTLVFHDSMRRYGRREANAVQMILRTRAAIAMITAFPGASRPGADPILLVAAPGSGMFYEPAG